MAARRLLTLALIFAMPLAARAAPDGPLVPEYLPKYHLDVQIDPAKALVRFRAEITWTNPSTVPTSELVVSFIPRYKIPDGEELLLAKTLELLRLHPSVGIDCQGRHGTIDSVRGLESKEVLPFHWKVGNQTAFAVELPKPVGPGESVAVEVAGSIRLPNKQGRWGTWDGVTYLANSMPTVAYYDAKGWHDCPFVPWHQPFWNEAGRYTAAITVPGDHVLACSAAVASEELVEGGRKRLTTRPFVGRDFAMVTSAKFHTHSKTVTLESGKSVEVRCLALPHHDEYARTIVDISAAAIPVYSKWFGDYPYSQLTLCESFFGWNGNELGGMILIDERVFDMPKLARGYVEYLVSHETCHQWWYNLVGTNGYSETFMDEGPATYFTHRLLDLRHGRNNRFLDWPDGFDFLPNIRRENYRYASMTGAIRRDEVPPAAGDLPTFGHLYGLFTGAYDRGSKVFGLIESRLGEAAFLECMQHIVAKYSFKVLSAEQFKRELIEFAGPQSAPQFEELFDRWVYKNGLVDWQLETVSVTKQAGPRVASKAGVRVEAVVRQSREYDEVTVVGFQMAEGDGYPVRVPVGPGSAARVQLGDPYETEVVPRPDGSTVVRVTLPGEPVQVSVDPDKVLMDADFSNNSWRRPVAVRVVPLYSFLYDTDLTNDYDKWNITAGPWVYGALAPDPWYTRTSLFGLRAGVYRTQQFYGGVYAAYRTDYRDLVVGADGLLDHWPFPRTQVGFNVEQRVGGPYGGNDGESTATRASVYGRYVLRYGSSLYLPPINYVDLFASYQDNFLPFARQRAEGAARPQWTQQTGLHYRLNLLTPYWDAERGVWVDAVYSAGPGKLEGERGTVGVQQLKAEVATTQKLPDGLGYFSDVKVALRGVTQLALPRRGEYFALAAARSSAATTCRRSRGVRSGWATPRCGCRWRAGRATTWRTT